MAMPVLLKTGNEWAWLEGNRRDMQKIDYNLKMKQIISNLSDKPKLLLHSCCAPCSSHVMQKIKEFFDITVVYYNPNIFPKEEYEKRKSEQIRLLDILNIKYLDCDYDENEFLKFVEGFENEKEGGARCSKCFLLRLEYTAKVAKEKHYNFFGTTLTVSPHKNAEIINNIGKALEDKYNINFLYSDFKKEEGYLKSIKLSNEYNLYRQNYCGCRYSINKDN